MVSACLSCIFLPFCTFDVYFYDSLVYVLRMNVSVCVCVLYVVLNHDFVFQWAVPSAILRNK